ncbi:MAG: alpha/beta hydrolase [Rhodovulum sp.]|nr:alpha/beta hydrolase [Rhodovulum sp.]|tara:strand:+ start:3028 stop:3951 length:924 start_codon:yes stop_codon:yes gene_type:complete
MSGATDVVAFPRDCQWDVDGLRLSGLAWGSPDGIPVLALHGWMDHAASFQELAPRLTGCHVVALDLSGQGMSANRSAHGTYNIWDDLPQITEVLDQLGWDRCVLLGHSRGAIIATLFAAALPEKVQALIALDALLPEPAAPDSFVRTLRAFLDENRKSKLRRPRLFKARSAYIDRRRAQGNSTPVAEALADRALEQVPEGFRMRGDLRLFASSAVRLTQAQLETVLRSLQCPVLNIWAKDSTDRSAEKTQALIALSKALAPQYQVIELPGDHHFHLEPCIAHEISRFVLQLLRTQPAVNQSEDNFDP